jgi:archaellum biogenesis ATPase FlaH
MNIAKSVTHDADLVNVGGRNAPPLAPASENDLLINGEYIPFDWVLEEPPTLEFCVNPYAPIGVVTLINGHGGTGKSLLALYMAVRIAFGLDVFKAPTRSGKVAYLSLEDSEIVFRERLFKIANTMPYQLAPRLQELSKKLMFINRYGIQTLVASSESGNVVESKILRDLIILLKAHDIKCLITDTFIRTHSLSENDNAQMGALLVLFEKVAMEAKCAVILIHHQPKGNVSREYASRGASAITDNARSVISLEKVNKNDADKFAEEHIRIAVSNGRLVRVVHTKHNYSAGHPEQYFEITKDGIPLERFPTINENGGLEQRYAEMFAWYQNQWGSKPITKTNIDDHYKEMRPKETSHGKETYKKALQWGIDKGGAVKVSAPEGASKNPKAEYYTLSSIEEVNPPPPQ